MAEISAFIIAPRVLLNESHLVISLVSSNFFRLKFISTITFLRSSFLLFFSFLINGFNVSFYIMIVMMILTFLFKHWTNLELFPVHSNHERFSWLSVSNLCTINLLLSILVNLRCFFPYSNFNEGQLVFTDPIILNDVHLTTFWNNSRLNHKYNFNNDNALNISLKTYMKTKWQAL